MRFDVRCQPIELLLSDVDGVLTDGSLAFDNQGIETKTFHVRDGLGIKLWRRAGFRFGVVTSRNSHIVKTRAAELSFDVLRQGVEEKIVAVQQVLDDLKISPEQAAYIGDDLPDLPVMRYVGLPVAVADASAEVKAVAALVTKLPGGRGAVREAIETILKAKNRWEDLIQKYVS
jgi:YrbI family 3-deoxy-D-manno-octulosonate 8-phosphate phosphatase